MVKSACTKIEHWPDARLFIILFAVFLVFYVAQLLSWTSNADVLAYACRASSENPIFPYQSLDQRHRSLIGLDPVPNYHIAHTAILWAVYHLVPGDWAQSIRPSGFVSSVSGALMVGLTFLIWTRLGVRREVALTTAVLAGLIPSIWYHSLIGEAYALQLCLSLLFLYYFVSGRVLASAAAFLSANLVTPLSGLSASSVFLKYRDRNTMTRMFVVGLIALTCYFAIYWMIDVNILKIFGPEVETGAQRSILWKILKLGETVCLNLHIFLPFLIWGLFIVWREHRDLLYGLFLGAAPQVLLIFYDSQFLIEGGAFLLFLFWILSFPAGVALWRAKNKRYILPILFVVSIVVTYGLWIIPSEKDGKERYDIGMRLRSETAEEMKIFGNWNASIGVGLGKFGWDFEKLSSHYVQLDFPAEEKLMKTDQNSAIIVEFLRERMGLSTWYEKIGLAAAIKSRESVVASFRESTLSPLYESDGMRVYRWDRFR